MWMHQANGISDGEKKNVPSKQAVAEIVDDILVLFSYYVQPFTAVFMLSVIELSQPWCIGVMAGRCRFMILLTCYPRGRLAQIYVIRKPQKNKSAQAMRSLCGQIFHLGNAVKVR
jgi:hypothetical protein